MNPNMMHMVQALAQQAPQQRPTQPPWMRGQQANPQMMQRPSPQFSNVAAVNPFAAYALMMQQRNGGM